MSGPPFVFTVDIPATPNNPSQDQPPMKVNTNSTAAIWDIDHFGMNDPQGGWHDVIHQPPVLDDPDAIPGIGQTYTKTVSGDQQLFFESGGGVIYNLSGVPISQNSVTTSFDTTTSYATLVTLPANCIGLLYCSFSTALASNVFFFVSLNSSASIAPPSSGSFPNQISVQMSGLNLQVKNNSSPPISMPLNYKLIYWQV